IRARLRSYGETSTRTRSPGLTRMRARRMRPAMWASTECPLSSTTRNIRLGRDSSTTPSRASFSSTAMADTSGFDGYERRWRRGGGGERSEVRGASSEIGATASAPGLRGSLYGSCRGLCAGDRNEPEALDAGGVAAVEHRDRRPALVLGPAGHQAAPARELTVHFGRLDGAP